MEKLWEKIKKSVVEGVSVAAEKTEEYTKLGKGKLDILNIKRKISKAFTELGGITYDSIKAGNIEEVMKSNNVEEIINTLKELESELDGKEEEYDEMKKKKPKTEEQTDSEVPEDKE